MTNKKVAKVSNEDSAKVAEKYYEPSDYKNNSTLSSGLATTHEQVSDTYTEGEIGAVIDDVAGKDVEIPRKGYND